MYYHDTKLANYTIQLRWKFELLSKGLAGIFFVPADHSLTRQCDHHR